MLGFVILVPVCLLWFIVLPPFVVAAWLLLRIAFVLRPDDTAPLPYFLETPWDLLNRAAAAFFCLLDILLSSTFKLETTAFLRLPALPVDFLFCWPCLCGQSRA